MKSLASTALMSTKAYSISELNAEIRQALGDAFPTALWVHGEVSGYRANASGHVYFDLVEKDPDKNSIVAKISCFLPAGLARFIQGKLNAAGLGGLKDDLDVQVLAEVDFYSPYGKLSLHIRDIEPAYTVGKLAQARQKIIEDLARRGLLEKNKQHLLSIVPLNIGLVTSDGSAAYHDFLETLGSSGYAFSVRLAAASMQGEGTEKSVVDALARLRKLKDLDLVAIVRGGGSRSDLAWFDNRAIAESIANSPYPILTGIGHEIDLSIADLCAHTSFKTPTAVAEFLCNRVGDFLAALDEKSKGISQTVRMGLQTEREKIRQAVQRISWPAISRLFIFAEEQVLRRAERSRALDPALVLQRGFTLTRGPDGRFLRSVRAVRAGSMIQTHLADGLLESEVRGVDKKKGLL